MDFSPDLPLTSIQEQNASLIPKNLKILIFLFHQNKKEKPHNTFLKLNFYGLKP